LRIVRNAIIALKEEDADKPQKMFNRQTTLLVPSSRSRDTLANTWANRLPTRA